MTSKEVELYLELLITSAGLNFDLFKLPVGEEIYQNDVSLLYLTPLQAFSLHIPSRHHPNSPDLFPSSPFGLRF
jgi:hypothetical protein